MLTDEQIRDLLAGCEGVTQGPWSTEAGADGTHDHIISANNIWIAANVSFPEAAHIARCDPQTISELCSRVLEAEARVKVLESVLAQYPNEEHAAALEAGR